MRRVPLILAALALVLLAAAPAWAGDLQDYKRRGLLGERPDGYVGMVKPDAPADAQSLMRDVNRKRRSHYEGIARKNKTDRTAVEGIVGKKLIGKAAPGTFVQDRQGRWRRK